MSKTWLSLLLALCMLLPSMNVKASDSSDEYFYDIYGELSDTDDTEHNNLFTIYYDPDSSEDEYVDITVGFEVYDGDTGEWLGYAENSHTIINGDEEYFDMPYEADYNGHFDFYISLYDGDDLEDEHWFQDILLEVDFICDNGETIPLGWYDDGYDDCGDGSDEPNSSDDEDDSSMGMGLPTGQLGFIMDELDEGDYEDAPENYIIDFITPHMADIGVTANFNMNSEESDLLREDIILATKLKEIEAYYVEGRTAIAADYLAGNTDDEETAEAFMSLYENATTSVIPEYTPDSSDFSFEFNTAELIREFVEFDDVTITEQDLDTYYDVAWGGGMNNMLTVDVAITFMIIASFVAAFDENMTDEEVEAGTAEMFLTSLMTCPETTTGFNAFICVMNQMDENPVMSKIFGEEEEKHLNFEAYCLHNTKQILTDTDDENPSCSADATTAFYNMSEDEISGFVMDEVNGLETFGFMNKPGGFPLEMPDIAMSIINTENVLGKFSDNDGKVANIEIEMVVSVFFLGVSAGDAHTFVINPELNEEILENVTTIQVTPPDGYTFGNDSADNTVNVENDDELITWTFIKTNEVDATNMTDEEIEEIEDSLLSELPGPSLILGILTIFVVAFTRRRL